MRLLRRGVHLQPHQIADIWHMRAAEDPPGWTFGDLRGGVLADASIVLGPGDGVGDVVARGKPSVAKKLGQKLKRAAGGYRVAAALRQPLSMARRQPVALRQTVGNKISS